MNAHSKPVRIATLDGKGCFPMISCSIEGCGKPHAARGWCNAHWERWRHHGDPLGGGTVRGETVRYFREVVLAYEGNDCLFWPYHTNKGYGSIRHNGRPHAVHRLVCEHVNGPPPTPLHHAAHSCGKGKQGCVTKGHLSWKTRAENEADKLLHGTSNRGEQHGMAKLTASDVLIIRELDGKLSRRNIADRMGIALETVRNIQTGKSWVWLEAGGAS
jgi:hypothetical protein